MSTPAAIAPLYRAAAVLAQDASGVTTRHNVTMAPLSVVLLLLAAIAVVALVVMLFQRARFRATGRTRDA